MYNFRKYQKKQLYSFLEEQQKYCNYILRVEDSK